MRNTKMNPIDAIDESRQTKPRAMVLTGYGLNCDYETDFSLRLAGAESYRIHINQLIRPERHGPRVRLEDYQILVLGGGFSWADDHGAGVLMAAKLKHHLGEHLDNFIQHGKLVLGICNGFQALVNLGLLPGFGCQYTDRRVALTHNDAGNFIDAWVKLKVNRESPCVFTRGILSLDLPVRHGEGKFYAARKDIERLLKSNQVVLQYAGENGKEARGEWPFNPNGSLEDIAGICDPSGRIFGLMPHPEAFNHYTNHPDWTIRKEALTRQGKSMVSEQGEGISIFRNAVEYVRNSFSDN
jgi:phosphoribosylformylglycinamidine synthase I